MSIWCQWGTIICRLRLFSREVNEKTDKTDTRWPPLYPSGAPWDGHVMVFKSTQNIYGYLKKHLWKPVYKVTFYSLFSWNIFFLVRQPPIITRFLSEDLVDRNEVKFEKRGGFKLPCAASGTNLTWTWKHNGTIITNTRGIPYLLSEGGTLKGNYLSTEHSGTYQCLVRDQITGIEVFSRRLQVAVTGKIANF